MRHGSRLSFTPVTRLAASILAAVLVLTALTVAVPAAAEAATTSHALSAPTSVHLGSSATMKATWITKGKRATGTVLLQKRSSGTWKTVTKVKLVKGKGSVAIKPTASATYRLHSATYNSASKTVKVVRNWLSFGPSAGASIKVGSSASLSLKVYGDGKPVTRVVALQRLSGKKWVTVQRLKVSSKGTTVAVKPTSTTKYRLVRYSLTSATRTVTVDRDWASLSFSSRSLATSTSTTTATATWYSAGKKATGTMTLQQRIGSGAWTTAAKVKVTGGTGTVTVKPLVSRTYRLLAGSVSSPSVKVSVKTVIPASFLVTGSGYGHGIGMSQYGAYAGAQAGNSATAILKHYYTGVSVAQTTMPTSPLSVQVFGPDPAYSTAYDDLATSVKVTVHDGGWRVRNNQVDPDTGKTGMTRAYSSTGETITFSVAAGGKVSATVDGKVVSTDTIERLHWESTSYYYPSHTTETYATVAGAQGAYRHGRLTVTNIGGYINVVNDLDLNTEYLDGIAEMPSSWGLKGSAALQAQAVAARSYALLKYQGGIKSWCNCHLRDDVRDQNFTGWKKENEGHDGLYGKTSDGYYGALWQAAVAKTVSGTTGLLLTYGGKPVATHYYSASGGATLNSEDVWASVVPYERSVSDPWSLASSSGNPNKTWTATLSQAQAKKYFGLSDVVAISVGTYTGGGLKSLKATSSTGATKTISGKADAMRASLNGAVTGYVKAPWIKTIAPVPPK